MASVQYLYNDAKNIRIQLVEKYEVQQDEIRTRHFAALIIQRSWRGYVVRSMIKFWNETATLIQKHVRGWLLRKRMPVILENYWIYLNEKHYSLMATKIQAYFRGYRVRKEMCIKAMLEDRARIEEVTLKLMELLKELIKKNKHMMKINGVEIENVWMEKCLNALCDRHHLLRTHQREGVLSQHGSKQLSHLEELLKHTSYITYMKRLKKIRDIHQHKDEPKIVQKSDNIQVKPPFILSTKIPPKPYERPLL